jgi:hypothetical protein
MLEGPKLKIKRANQHIRDLNTAIQGFIQTDFCHIRLDEYPDGSHGLALDCAQPIPDEWALIIGDAVHNLHSALDLAACEIVRTTGKEPDRSTKFPFFRKRNEVIGAINTGKIKAAGQDVIDLIVDMIKPYQGGNDALYGLHDMDILDKHLLIIPVLAVASIDIIEAEGALGSKFENVRLQAPQGNIFNVIGTPDRLHIKKHGKPTFDVRFGKAQIFDNQPVIPTLHQLSQLVAGIIEAIEQTYLARKTHKDLLQTDPLPGSRIP